MGCTSGREEATDVTGRFPVSTSDITSHTGWQTMGTAAAAVTMLTEERTTCQLQKTGPPVNIILLRVHLFPDTPWV